METDLSGFDDFRLMALVREGRREAFAEIVRRHQRNLVNFFVRMNADYDSAEDLAQTAFLRLFEYRERYQPTRPLRVFLHTLALHAWADWARRRKHMPAALDGAEPGGKTGPGPLTPSGALDPFSRADARIDIEAALANLSEKLRAVVVLAYSQGLSRQEIADVLDIPVGTVKSRLFLAMEALREHLKP